MVESRNDVRVAHGLVGRLRSSYHLANTMLTDRRKGSPHPNPGRLVHSQNDSIEIPSSIATNHNMDDRIKEMNIDNPAYHRELDESFSLKLSSSVSIQLGRLDI